MAITADCGHHCGARSNAEGTRFWEGHCSCMECSCPVVRDTIQIPLPQLLPVPMCGLPEDQP